MAKTAKKTAPRRKAAAKKTAEGNRSKPKPSAKPVDRAIEKQVRKILEAGRLATIDRYQTFVGRIAKGESLKASEMKQMREDKAALESMVGGVDEPHDGTIHSYDEAAAFCGFSTRTLNWHISRGNLKQRPDGTFSKKALVEFLKTKGRDGGDKISIQKAEAEVRLRVAKAQTQELVFQQMQGNVYTREEVEREWAGRLVVVWMTLERFAARMAALLANKSQEEIYNLISKEVYEMQRAYAEPGEYCPLPEELRD